MGIKFLKITRLSLVVIIIMAITVAFLYLLQREQVYLKIKDSNRSLIESEIGYFDQVTTEWTNILHMLAVNPQFRAYIKANQEKQSAKSLLRQQEKLENVFSETGYFQLKHIDSLRYIDANGMEKVVSERGKALREYRNLADKSYFITAMNQAVGEISKTQFETTQDKAYIHKSLPIIANGKIAGLLILSVDIESLLSKYQYLVAADITHQIFVLSRQGKAVYHTPPTAFDKKELKHVYETIKQTSSKNPILEYQKNVWSYLKNDNFNFYVLFKSSGENITAQINEEYKKLSIVFAASSFILVLFVFISARNMQRQQGQVESRKVIDSQRSFHFSSISDEIRPPINTLLGSLSTVLETTKLDDKQKRYVDEAKKSADCLLELVNEFHDFSKINKGDLQLEEIEFDIRTTVHDIAELMSAQAYKKGLEVSCLVSSNVPLRVIADVTRLRQVLINLISFAVKYTDHGEISLHVSAKDKKQGNSLVSIDVSDTGNVVDQDTMLEHFRMFTDVNSYSEDSFGSKGLGLALSTQILGLMKGQITVEENNTGGNTFSVQLPMRIGQATSPPKPRDNLARKKVLIIGEVEKNRLSLSKALSGWGMSGATMEDFNRVNNVLREAKLAGNEYHVCLIDVSLSSSSEKAFKVAKEIRKEFAEGELAIIILTAQGSAGDARIAKQHLVQGYLTKPINRETMHQMLLQVMDQSVEQMPDIVTRHTLKEAGIKSSYRILAAEADVDAQKLLVKYLNKLGLQIDVAANGDATEAAMKQKFYDMILLDGRLPGMDVLDFTNNFRHDEETFSNSISHPSGVETHVPIVAVINRSDITDIDKYKNNGFDNIILKPIDENELQTVVGKYLELEEETADSAI